MATARFPRGVLAAARPVYRCLSALRWRIKSMADCLEQPVTLAERPPPRAHRTPRLARMVAGNSPERHRRPRAHFGKPSGAPVKLATGETRLWRFLRRLAAQDIAAVRRQHRLEVVDRTRAGRSRVVPGPNRAYKPATRGLGAMASDRAFAPPPPASGVGCGNCSNCRRTDSPSAAPAIRRPVFSSRGEPSDVSDLDLYSDRLRIGTV